MSSEELRRRAKHAGGKTASYGDDIDVDNFQVAPRELRAGEDLESLDRDLKDSIINVGVVPDQQERAGSFLLLDNSIVHTSKQVEGLEVMSTQEALKRYDWAKDFVWNAVQVDTDKYTAKTFMEDSDGYFIRVKSGVHVAHPVQAGQVLDSVRSMQNVHNVIIVEEGASMQFISGCTSTHCAKESLHLAASELYVMKGGSLTFTTIHNWASDISARPRTVIKVAEDATFIDNYISLGPIRSIQLYPKVFLDGPRAKANFSSISVAPPGCKLDMGCMAVLGAPETRARIVSRSITTGGEIINRGRLVGLAPMIKAHLECNSLIMADGGISIAIPELEARLPDVEMTHEAAVGKVAQDQVEYLMARGLSEDEAVGIIVRGVLEGGIVGLPDQIRLEVEKAIDQTNIGAL